MGSPFGKGGLLARTALRGLAARLLLLVDLARSHLNTHVEVYPRGNLMRLHLCVVCGIGQQLAMHRT